MFNITNYRGVEIQFVGGMYWISYEFQTKTYTESSTSLKTIKKYIDTLLLINGSKVAKSIVKVGA